jgi:hypothetical protein
LRRAAPLLAALVSVWLIVGNPRPVGHLGAAGYVLGYARTIGAAALLLGVFVVVIVSLDDFARRLVGRMAGPRPRWQYLLLAAGYGCVAGLALFLAAGRGAGLAASIWGTAGVWAGLAWLVMLGRAVCPGRARRVFWRHLPAGPAGVSGGPGASRPG